MISNVLYRAITKDLPSATILVNLMVCPHHSNEVYSTGVAIIQEVYILQFTTSSNVRRLMPTAKRFTFTFGLPGDLRLH